MLVDWHYPLFSSANFHSCFPSKIRATAISKLGLVALSPLTRIASVELFRKEPDINENLALMRLDDTIDVRLGYSVLSLTLLYI